MTIVPMSAVEFISTEPAMPPAVWRARVFRAFGVPPVLLEGEPYPRTPSPDSRIVFDYIQAGPSAEDVAAVRDEACIARAVGAPLTDYQLHVLECDTGAILERLES